MIKNIQIVIAIFICQISFAFQVNDTINIDSNHLQIDKLSLEQANYLVYIELPNGTMKDISIWQRETAIANNQIVIKQKWRNQDIKKTRELFSSNSLTNFEPIHHFVKNGNGDIEAFDFDGLNIKGSDSIQNNLKKDFNLDLGTKTLNWELDIGVFQTLPFQLNKTFVINFYHPGSKRSPAYYQYKVLNKENLTNANGTTSECWVLQIDYGKNNTATFWIDVQTRHLLKMEESFGTIKRYKIKF